MAPPPAGKMHEVSPQCAFGCRAPSPSVVARGVEPAPQRARRPPPRRSHDQRRRREHRPLHPRKWCVLARCARHAAIARGAPPHPNGRWRLRARVPQQAAQRAGAAAARVRLVRGRDGRSKDSVRRRSLPHDPALARRAVLWTRLAEQRCARAGGDCGARICERMRFDGLEAPATSGRRLAPRERGRARTCPWSGPGRRARPECSWWARAGAPVALLGTGGPVATAICWRP